ncbi:hypothetical protein GCM10010425_79010 [Streptomyces spororaveus]|uniref:Uncharacterized protein n=1 Tax=Streptomyces spororaveus TaxID=284039 RepID=A0ABQ3TPD7_9ACTN|nr:hypothetical protein Sspor_78350 [Streptomyces spororaveus]
MHPVPRTAHFVDAHLELVQQLVQPHPRYLRQRIPHTHALPLRRPLGCPIHGQGIDTRRPEGRRCARMPAETDVTEAPDDDGEETAWA